MIKFCYSCKKERIFNTQIDEDCLRCKEIHKRDYQNIKGLKAQITEKCFDYFLEVLPPMNWENENGENSFYLSECLTENLYYKFYETNNIFYCEVCELNNIDEDFL